MHTVRNVQFLAPASEHVLHILNKHAVVFTASCSSTCFCALCRARKRQPECEVSPRSMTVEWPAQLKDSHGKRETLRLDLFEGKKHGCEAQRS
jgi:ferredoxin